MPAYMLDAWVAAPAQSRLRQRREAARDAARPGHARYRSQRQHRSVQARWWRILPAHRSRRTPSRVGCTSPSWSGCCATSRASSCCCSSSSAVSADPEPELRRTYEFLGLERSDIVPPGIAERVNVGAPPFDLRPEIVEDMTVTLAKEVQGLVKLFPELDPGLWPSVRELL